MESGGETLVPQIPNTIAKSIAIGNPADGVFAARAMRGTGGWSAAVSDDSIVAAIRLLAETTGIFTETAGGATVAAALALAEQGRFGRDDEVVLCITGNGLKTLECDQWFDRGLAGDRAARARGRGTGGGRSHAHWRGV